MKRPLVTYSGAFREICQRAKCCLRTGRGWARFGRCLRPSPVCSGGEKEAPEKSVGGRNESNHLRPGIRAKFVNVHLSRANVGQPPRPLSISGLVTRWPDINSYSWKAQIL